MFVIIFNGFRSKMIQDTHGPQNIGYQQILLKFPEGTEGDFRPKVTLDFHSKCPTTTCAGFSSMSFTRRQVVMVDPGPSDDSVHVLPHDGRKR